ncbi:MAG: sensor histidine kinase, partial [Candidatus Promineifilaceae bacterium]
MSFSSLIIVFLVGIASFYFLSFVEPVANVRLALGGILLGLVLLLITMVVSTARLLDQTLFQPLQNLHESSQRIAEGDFNQQIVAVQQDEIGEFATVLDEMRQALRLRDTRIAAQNKALGEEVNSRKIAQEKLQKLNAELVQSSRYKDQFLATMSHELRTPLNAILGMSEALIVPVYGELNDQQRKAVLHVRDSGRHLLSLIDDILDLSKIAAGRSPLETSVLEIEPIIDASVGMIRPISDAKRLTMRTFVDPQARILIADEQRLKQILINLLNNAVKFTHEGGMISLIVRGRHSDNAIEIEVADTGIGIPQASLEHLFEPFVQIDGSLSRQHGGAGLGLTLVQR